jgi:excisionase family DNA binding protein
VPEMHHMDATTPERADITPQLALRPKEAAKALDIGVRLLWSLTNRGEIPHVRLGRRIVYPISALEAWLAEKARGKGGDRR